MRFSTVAAALTSAVVVSAANITVQVGAGSMPVFSPSNVTAQAGDIIQFQFVAKVHSATQSTFATPCTAMAGGIDSGLQNASAITNGTVPEWSFVVNDDTTPLWFYCKYPNHCPSGMVFSVNANANKTFAAFQAAAIATANSTSTNGTSSASPSASVGSGDSGSSSSTASGSSPSTSGTSNSAMRLGSSAAGALAIIGVVAGLL